MWICDSGPVSLGEAPRQLDLLDPVTRFCDESLPASSIYGFLFRERDRLFADELFTDLFAAIGRRSVPPSVVAVVMVLQRLEGLSDREAVDRFTFDARWRYAAGVGGWDGAGPVGFANTRVGGYARTAAPIGAAGSGVRGGVDRGPGGWAGGPAAGAGLDAAV